MGTVKDLIAQFNGDGENEARHEEARLKEVCDEKVRHEHARQHQEVAVEDPEIAEDLETAMESRSDDLENIAVFIVHDPLDEIVAEQLLDSIQPLLHLPVCTVNDAMGAGKIDEVIGTAVAAVLVSAAMEENDRLIEAVARKLPNALVPVIVDKNMVLQKSWHGPISWHMANELHFDFCDPETATISFLLDQVRAKANGERLDKVFDAFISHEWGVHDIAKKLAMRLEKNHGLKMWLDEKEVMGSVDESMSRGIEGSQIFLVLATKRYMDKVNFGDRSDNCLKEFRHAGNQRADRTVVAALETTMTKAATKWTGSFQLALARQTPVNLVKLSDDAVERLANAIRMRIDTPKASSDLTPLMRDIYPRLSPFSSEVWAKGKAVKFTVGTRSWILDSLCNWHRRNRSAVFILAGDGGVGKSVVMAELCFRGGALQIDEHMEGFKINLSTKPFRKLSLVRSLWRRSKRERSPIFVAAYHFFRHDQATAAAPKEALVSIAWQLCQSVPGFAEMLDTMKIEDVRDKALPDMFQIILIDPLSKLGPDMARQVVVIDALDECSKSDELLQNVVRKWKDSMPPWLNLVMSTRLEGEIKRIITNNNLDYKVLELKDAENLRDIELHIKHLLREMSDVVQAKNLAECAKILSKRSDGLFLWAGFLPNALKQAHRKKHHGPLTMQDILEEDVIPAGLGGMFEEYFERLLVKVGGDDVYKALMAPLVAAREPLSVEHLSSLLGKSKQKTAAIVNDARNLLHKGGDGRVALIHKRMADWLSDSEQSGARLCVDLDKGHERLAEYCGVHDDAFAFRHAVFHCIKSGNS